jgi:alkylation response protein AidB-like acyl-CoA dehydrogenase
MSAFALSEPDAGSDVAAMECRATQDGDHWVLNGCKTWISNAGIADFYTVFARTDDSGGAKGISCFIVEAGTLGFEVTERIDLVAPHPLGTLNSRTAASDAQLVGDEGEASASPWQPWTSFAPPSRPPHWAWRGERWMKRLTTPQSATFLVARWETCSSFRPK